MIHFASIVLAARKVIIEIWLSSFPVESCRNLRYLHLCSTFEMISSALRHISYVGICGWIFHILRLIKNSPCHLYNNAFNPSNEYAPVIFMIVVRVCGWWQVSVCWYQNLMNGCCALIIRTCPSTLKGSIQKDKDISRIWVTWRSLLWYICMRRQANPHGSIYFLLCLGSHLIQVW